MPAHPLRRFAPVCTFILTSLLVLNSARAEEASKPESAKPLAPAATVPPQKGVPDASVEFIIIEDDGNRVEELRVRGQTRSVHVQPKCIKAPEYEILMGDGSRDLSAGASSARGAIGQRVWRVISF